MKIIPQVRFPNAQLSRIPRREHFNQVPQDIFESVVPKTVSRFKHIKLKIAEKMYNTEFTPSSKGYGEYSYRAFVFDKKTDKPVEVVVKPRIFDEMEEEYLILDPHNAVTAETIARSGGICCSFNKENWGMPVVGMRDFFYDNKNNDIVSGVMNSYGRNEYEGLGFIEHQMTVERFLMSKRKNLDIFSVPSAYFFHKNCGFEVIKHNDEFNAQTLEQLVNNCIEQSKLDRATIEKLLVCRKITKDEYLVDINSTFENIIKHLYKEHKSLKGFNYFCLDMKLSKKALKEWEKIIEKHPIFMGKKMPDKIRPKGISQ